VISSKCELSKCLPVPVLPILRGLGQVGVQSVSVLWPVLCAHVHYLPVVRTCFRNQHGTVLYQVPSLAESNPYLHTSAQVNYHRTGTVPCGGYVHLAPKVSTNFEHLRMAGRLGLDVAAVQPESDSPSTRVYQKRHSAERRP